jgi:hypothetical protein
VASDGQAVSLPTSYTAHKGSQRAVRAFMRCIAVTLFYRPDATSPKSRPLVRLSLMQRIYSQGEMACD